MWLSAQRSGTAKDRSRVGAVDQGGGAPPPHLGRVELPFSPLHLVAPRRQESELRRELVHGQLNARLRLRRLLYIYTMPVLRDFVDSRRVDCGVSAAFRRWGVVAGYIALAWATLPVGAADSGVQFNRDIRPILADNCMACHGPDNNARKAGLRLDTKEGLFERTPKRGPAVVAGRPDQSELWKHVSSTDPDEIMPPPDSHKKLKPEQKEMLRKWILAGAPWQGHWAYLKPERPAVPLVGKSVISGKGGGASGTGSPITDSLITLSPNPSFPIRNPIDAFVLARLQSKGLKPNPEADRAAITRRLSLDLTGLPPKPELIEGFVKDKSPEAYAKLTKELLSTPAWGEHRARYWLDAARYADTHGLHFDNYREMWPYRDWVIQAFSSNLRFNVFIIKQLAGDLLTDPDTDDLVATGFQRCNMTTNEGGTIDEENQANYANDRVATTGWVFLGSTMNCCACHDHKFDPFKQKDFYALEAFYRNTTQPPKDGNSKDSTPSILVAQTPEDAKRWTALPGELDGAKAKVEERRKEARPAFAPWLADAKPEDFEKDLPSGKLLVHLPLNEKDTNQITAAAGRVPSIKLADAPEWQDGELGPALVLKKDATLNLGDQGDFERTNAFSYGCWMRASKTDADAGILTRMEIKDDYRGWDLYQNNKRVAAHFVHKWPDDAFKVSTKDDVLKDKAWHHVFVTYDGSSKAKGVKLYVDGVEAKVKVDKDELKGSIRTKAPLRVGERTGGHVFERGRVQDVRLYGRKLDGAEVKSLAKAVRLQSFLRIATDQRTKEQSEGIFDYWLTTRDPLYLERSKDLAAFKSEEDAIKERNPITHIQREKTNSMPMANILFRGQYDKPKDKVTAATPGVLHAWPKNAPTNRLGLAQWMISPENPLTARVTVNRFWQEVFGTGLVKSTEDFGTTSEPPANQELLDWLAVEFIESGWDVKHIFELMVTSSTYRQSSEITREKLEKDPQNRFLSRGPRFRMDAEMVRDYALTASGLLAPKIGGASVKPYQPDGLWEAVAMPESNTKKYQRDTGEALYRRSLYTFWKRAAPPATMDIFNAPSREVCSVRRERTNTPLQALATLNDPQFVEAARHLAELAMSGRSRDEEMLQFMAARLLARTLSAKELSIVKGTLKEMRSYYEQQPDAAKQLISTGESKPAENLPAPQLAAMTMVANQLMNLDETLNK